MSKQFDVGDLARATATFKDEDDQVVDPANVYFQVKDPVGALLDYQYGVDAELVKESTGVYHVDVSVTMPGEWHYRFYSTGSGQAAIEDVFYGKETHFL